MQGQAGRLAEALERVRQHLGRERADPLVLEAEVGDAEGPGGDVDDGAGEGFVEGRVRGAEAAEAGAGAEGGGEGAAEGEEGVFGRVVVVDWGIFVSSGEKECRVFKWYQGILEKSLLNEPKVFLFFFADLKS